MTEQKPENLALQLAPMILDRLLNTHFIAMNAEKVREAVTACDPFHLGVRPSLLSSLSRSLTGRMDPLKESIFTCRFYLFHYLLNEGLDKTINAANREIARRAIQSDTPLVFSLVKIIVNSDETFLRSSKESRVNLTAAACAATKSHLDEIRRISEGNPDRIRERYGEKAAGKGGANYAFEEWLLSAAQRGQPDARLVEIGVGVINWYQESCEKYLTELMLNDIDISLREAAFCA